MRNFTKLTKTARILTIYLSYSTVCFCLALLHSCYWAHRDDVLPSPYVNTPITPSTSLVNVIARHTKLTEILIKIVDSSQCLAIVPYSRTVLEFSKVSDQQILKTFDPIEKKMLITLRLEPNEKYKITLRGLSGENSEKTFFAGEDDIKLELASLCRKN